MISFISDEMFLVSANYNDFVSAIIDIAKHYDAEAVDALIDKHQSIFLTIIKE